VKYVKISSCGEQSVISDDEENVSDNSSTWHGIWAKLGAERRFPFTEKSGINVDSEDPRNPLEYFELFSSPEIIARGTNQYAKYFFRKCAYKVSFC
jgi:hypothetical protein